MQCDCGRYSIKKPCAICQWDRETAAQPKQFNFVAVSTVSFRQNKNVPISRINMIKRRKLARDGRNGEVILTNHSGKETSRRASDY